MTEYKTLFTSPIPPFIQKNHIFFDIETTGLHAKASIVYLIGLLLFKNNQWYQIQLLNEDGESEAKMIQHFFTYITKQTICIHYNGTTFDVPYLKIRCEQLGISTTPLEQLQQYDYYSVIRPLKTTLQMKDCKQHTVEQYAGFIRTNQLSGKKLIEQYFLYLKLKKDSCLESLLLHNADDLKGLTFISYFSIFSFVTTNISCINEKPLEFLQENTIFELELTLPIPFPTTLHIEKTFSLPSSFQEQGKASSFSLSLLSKENTCFLRCTLIQGTLKFFYPNYKEYYYLPAEDMAIHKSVASFVEKEYRQKATASTCYTKKNGLFLPLFDNSEQIQDYIFYSAYKEKQGFLLFDSLTKETKHIWARQAIKTLGLPPFPREIS